MEDIFSKTFSFDVKKQSLFNGSLDILVPNLPAEFDKFHVEVIVSAIQDGVAAPAKVSEPKPKQKQKPKEPEPVEHTTSQNRDYRNYVNAVKRARKK